jgi:hypothetical protein
VRFLKKVRIKSRWLDPIRIFLFLVLYGLFMQISRATTIVVLLSFFAALAFADEHELGKLDAASLQDKINENVHRRAQDAIRRAVRETCTQLLASSVPERRPGMIDRFLEENPVLINDPKFLKQSKQLVPNLDLIIEEILVRADAEAVQELSQVIKAFSGTSYVGPAANWFLNFVMIQNLSATEQKKARDQLIRQLEIVEHDLSHSFKSYERRPVNWVERRNRPRLEFKAYLMFLPVLSHILKGREGNQEYNSLWMVYFRIEGQAHSMLYNLPEILDHVEGDDEKYVDGFDTIFDASIDNILECQEWIDQAREILSIWKQTASCE